MNTVHGRPRAVLFDWDDTLADNWRAIHRATNATLEAMGLPTQSYETSRQTIRRSMRDTFPKRFGDRWQEATEIFYATYRAEHLETLIALPGSGVLLDELRRRGLYLAIVSNKQGEILRAEAAQLGWADHFTEIVGAGDAARDKPAPDPVAKALGRSGISPAGDVWLVGDSPLDMECATVSGCRPVLIRDQPPTADQFGGWMPDLHVSDCAALAAILTTL